MAERTPVRPRPRPRAAGRTDGARRTGQAPTRRPLGRWPILAVALVVALAALGVWVWQGNSGATMVAAWNVKGNPGATVAIEDWSDFQ
jgi:hypothetical protein